MHNIPSLKPGAVLGVSAPSAYFDPDKITAGIDLLKDRGFRVVVPEQIYNRKRYLAGEDRSRAMVLNQLFANPEIDAVICARGGFGSLRTLAHLDWHEIRTHPKPLIGFSDITALLLAVMERTQAPVIHGPTLGCLGSADLATIDSFFNILSHPADRIHAPAAEVLIQGKVHGTLKGGNLSTISHLMGTPFQPVFDDCILFLEDTNEPAYKIDRMLTQMKVAGVFTHLSGVVCGTFENNDNADYIREILVETFSEFNIPVLHGLDCGHGAINLSLPLGVKVLLDTAESTLYFGDR